MKCTSTSYIHGHGLIHARAGRFYVCGLLDAAFELLKNKGCVTLWPCHFTLKSILRQKKSYENSNISPCKNIIFKKTL
jgi:hypothetical protein